MNLVALCVCVYSYSTEGSGKMVELVGEEISINVGSFGGAVVTVRVGKKKGMERVDLLQESLDEPTAQTEDDGDGLWSALSKYDHSLTIVMKNS